MRIDAAPSDSAQNGRGAAERRTAAAFQFPFSAMGGDVLDWLAEQADLSLQSDIVPEGTLNYADRHDYTATEAIDLINGILLTKGYTLVRRGRLLTVIFLEDEVPDALSSLFRSRSWTSGDFELVKTIFHLAKIEPADAQQEIQQCWGRGELWW